MDLKLQKRLAADLLKCSKKRVKMDPSRINDIGEALTKTDIRELIGEGAIWSEQKKGVSRSRANKRQEQKRKGLRKGPGTKKGTHNARVSKKKAWANKVRAQRSLVRELKSKEIIDQESYKKLMGMVKGGFFRSKRHIKLFINERGMAKEAEQ